MKEISDFHQDFIEKMVNRELEIIERAIRTAFDQLHYEYPKDLDRVMVVRDTFGNKSYYINHGTDFEFLILQMSREMTVKHLDNRVTVERVYKTVYRTK